ncbi:MAG: hypothetical protein V3R57_07740 [Candidatus Bathyarchaeia archaeon]
MKVTCLKCNGTGILPGVGTCWDCHGAGLITEENREGIIAKIHRYIVTKNPEPLVRDRCERQIEYLEGLTFKPIVKESMYNLSNPDERQSFLKEICYPIEGNPELKTILARASEQHATVLVKLQPYT